LLLSRKYSTGLQGEAGGTCRGGFIISYFDPLGGGPDQTMRKGRNPRMCERIVFRGNKKSTWRCKNWSGKSEKRRNFIGKNWN